MTSFSLLLTEILTLLQNFNISYKNIDITHRNIDITHRNNDSNFIFTVGVIFALLTEEINQGINIYWLFYLYLVTPLIFLPCPNQTSRNLSCFLNFFSNNTYILFYALIKHSFVLLMTHIPSYGWYKVFSIKGKEG
jgi:hypothetical protein